MNDYITVVGMDVHKEKIAVAVLDGRTNCFREITSIENRRDMVEKFIKRLSVNKNLEFVYEAGPCGYELQRQISDLGYKCAVVAPGLTPVRPGDKVKTDRRDAEKLARYHRAGELTEVHIPTKEEESSRDLLRAREAIIADRLRSRHRILKFLLRQGRRYEKTHWGVNHEIWLKSQKFEYDALNRTFESYLRTLDDINEHLKTIDGLILELASAAAYRIPVQYLRCFKGIDTLSAVTLLVEAQDFWRFKSAREFMCYTGLVGSEYSSADRVVRGKITRTGNAHIRRVLVEAAWAYRKGNATSRELLERRANCPVEVLKIAKKAQNRLVRKFWKMICRNKKPQVVVVAIARELAGFVWAMSREFPVSVTV